MNRHLDRDQYAIVGVAIAFVICAVVWFVQVSPISAVGAGVGTSGGVMVASVTGLVVLVLLMFAGGAGIARRALRGPPSGSSSGLFKAGDDLLQNDLFDVPHTGYTDMNPRSTDVPRRTAD